MWIWYFFLCDIHAKVILTDEFHQNRSAHAFVFTLYDNINDQVAVESNALIQSLASIYEDEEMVQIHLQSSRRPKGKHSITEQDLILDYYPKVSEAIQCLKSGNPPPEKQRFPGTLTLPELVQYVNDKANLFYMEDGEPSSLGKHVKGDADLYRVQKIGESCATMDGTQFNWKTFYHDYFLLHKPVLIKNSANTIFDQWKDPEYLKSHFGTQKLHAKLAPDGIFEGVEDVEDWLQGTTVELPAKVEAILKQHYINVVVVRPATMELTFEDFLEKLKSLKDSRTNIYLEYLSMASFTSLVEPVVDKCEWLKGLPQEALTHQNLWYGNGKTTGKLHFDPYENFLTQISGRKELTMYDPYHNQNLYEGHLREAKLEYNENTDTFSRNPSQLLESTSMVNSPLDLRKLDFSKFPQFVNAKQMRCAVEEGDTLYLPSFWWHEVRSVPSKKAQDNIAFNTWYEPFYTKEFPCATCSFYWNRKPYFEYVAQFQSTPKDEL